MRPLLDSGDLAHAFQEKREEYKRRKESLAGTEIGLDHVMAREARFDDSPAAAFNEHRDVIGEREVKGSPEAVNLRRIVRESVIPYRETWPEESWERIARLMTGSELCLAGILEFAATGRGSKENALTLAGWGFQYALDAYWDAGRYGQDSTKLEDITISSKEVQMSTRPRPGSR